MIELLKFRRKNGEYKYTKMNKSWTTETGIHYICYPFMIYKDSDQYKLTHMSSGAMVCATNSLHSAKYIATRLFPLPQWLLPTDNLVKAMSTEQIRFCTDIINRYRNETKGDIQKLDKNCPYSI
jgi:hypothetical protein